MGTLVEVKHIGLEADKKNHGVRLYVVAHHKDAKVIDKISVELTKDEIQDIVQWGNTCEEEGWLIEKEVNLKDRLSKIIL